VSSSTLEELLFLLIVGPIVVGVFAVLASTLFGTFAWIVDWIRKKLT